MLDFLIRNGEVLMMPTVQRPTPRGSGAQIAYVGLDDSSTQAGQTNDAEGKIVVPGGIVAGEPPCRLSRVAADRDSGLFPITLGPELSNLPPPTAVRFHETISSGAAPHVIEQPRVPVDAGFDATGIVRRRRAARWPGGHQKIWEPMNENTEERGRTRRWNVRIAIRHCPQRPADVLVFGERLVQNDTNRLFGKSVPCAQVVLKP